MRDVKKDFPILSEMINNHRLIYVDNASTTQKPQYVLDALMHFYTTSNANVFRGIHTLGDRATSMYERARAVVAAFIGASDASDIVFTKGTTEGVNFVASTWGIKIIAAGDEIVITELEHHANILPWQRLAQQTGALLKYIPVQRDGTLDMDQMRLLVTTKTKLVAVTHESNVLGTKVDIQAIIDRAHAVGARVLIDAAQSVPHQKIDVKALGCDFFVFSGHKMGAPTGIGVLYIKHDLHDTVPPYQLGGGMVLQVDAYASAWLAAPHKFEAGTPPIAQAVGLCAAIEYMQANIDFDVLQKYEASLCAQLIDGLSMIDGVRLLGPLEQLANKGHMVSFVVDGIHGHDVVAYLNRAGICARAGHHCAQPLAIKLDVQASVRISFYSYNTHEDVTLILEVMQGLVRKFN